ncbi:hypothetical protein ACFODZ_16960 [Marinicella sediminis]|uniref:Uncharacterized protein n=1 Tax=Marinicella sediminis TaxID=1792834 RepID=A0ABV7JCU9_9GAMM|nr:hypothetical protein [Marinicella sediminis]
MEQSYNIWKPDYRITEPFGGISVFSLGNGHTILLLHGSDNDLKLEFSQIHAMTIHEEFAHPHVDYNENIPAIPNNNGGYPLLVVENSEWIKSFTDSRLQGDGRIPVHYQFLSMSYFVDVLSYEPPISEWVKSNDYDSVFSAIEP